MSNCSKEMSFEECELTIIRNAVDEAEKRNSKEIINNPQINNIIKIVEEFLKNKKLICYGGTAINNILPKKAQFYDRSLELPDYDFYSPNPISDAKELADIYFKNGFIDIEAKAGVHHGTYKVFVNFMPIADITYINPDLFNSIKKDSIKIDNIFYAPVNFLRMSMYLELSRPNGDVSRWEKVLKRLSLLNKYYPLKGDNCKNIKIQRPFESNLSKSNIFKNIIDIVSQKNAVLFGGYANILYSKYMPKKNKKKFVKDPDFDILSENPDELSMQIKEKLENENFTNVKIYFHEGIGEIISPHYEIMIARDTIAFIYEPLACHSYNIIEIDNKKLRIATIDTMLSFYLAFLYANRSYYDVNRIFCMSQYLFEVQQHNRLKQDELLKRFSMTCYGKQKTIIKLKEEKAEKYKELKNNINSKEYEEWFLKYEPGSKKNNEKKGTITPDVLKFLKNTKKRIKINNKTNKTKRKNKKNHKKHHKKTNKKK